MSVPNQCLPLGGAKSSGECSFGVCRPADRKPGIAFATVGDDSTGQSRITPSSATSSTPHAEANLFFRNRRHAR